MKDPRDRTTRRRPARPPKRPFSAARAFGSIGLAAGAAVLVALFTPPAYHLASNLHLSMIAIGAGLLIAGVVALTSVRGVTTQVNALAIGAAALIAIAPFTPWAVHMAGPIHLAMLLAAACLLGTSAMALILARTPAAA